MKQDKLDKAIADFEDESLDLSLGERITSLRSALTKAAIDVMKKKFKVEQMRGTTLKEEMTALTFVKEEQAKVNDCFKMLSIIERLFKSQVAQNKMLGKGSEAGMASADFLKKIKEETGSMGDIVRSLRPSEN